MSAPKISVIIPVYGVERFIERCARSLFEQTMTDGVEYIFVNDCTKDGSMAILESVIEDYPARKPFVKVIHHERNAGLAGTRNTGLDNAGGAYVAMVDSDDYVDTGMLEALYKKAVEGDFDIVGSNFFWQYEKYNIPVGIRKRGSKEEYLTDILERTSPPSWWGRIYRRAIIEENKVRLPVSVNMGEDLCTVPRIFYFAKRVAFIDSHFYHYVQYNESSYTKCLSQKNVDGAAAAFAQLDTFFADKEELYKNALKYGKVITRFMLACATRGSAQKSAVQMFPEADTHTCLRRLPWLYRIAHFCIEHNWLGLLNAILSAKDIVNKVRKPLQRKNSR
jgi:glycosyltransferase involved in cell wall biosynthesis